MGWRPGLSGQALWHGGLSSERLQEHQQGPWPSVRVRTTSAWLRLSCGSPRRAGHESLAGRPHVWLPVPERLQPCDDPALSEAARQSAADHRDGGVQPGAAAHPGAGGRGRTWSRGRIWSAGDSGPGQSSSDGRVTLSQAETTSCWPMLAGLQATISRLWLVVRLAASGEVASSFS